MIVSKGSAEGKSNQLRRSHRILMDYYEIPVQKLDEGLKQCAKNIRQFKKDVEVLLKSASNWHAIALAIFACEELGKYRALLEAKKIASGGIGKVDKLIFGFGGRRSHEYKMQLAQERLPAEALTLIPRYVISSAHDPITIDKVEASAQIRLTCLFLDWNPKTKDWDFGTPMNPDHLTGLVDAVIAALNKLETS